MKITILGGGALRLLGVLDDILTRPAMFDRPQLCFMDLDVPRAETIATLCHKMPSATANMPETIVTADPDAALDGADFVLCYIRVGGVIGLEQDKRIGAAAGFHGHDDFGPSGVMLTARTVPIVLDIARRMESKCPSATFLIFSNPITNLADAVTRYTGTRAIGLCEGVNNFAWDMDHLFKIGVPNPDLYYQGGGLNHLSWILPETRLGDKLVMDMIWDAWDDLPNREGAAMWDWKHNNVLVERDRVMPMNNGHHVHFFFHEELARRMADGFAATPPDEHRSALQNRAAAQAAELATQSEIENFWEQDALRGCGPSPFDNLGVKAMAAITSDSGAEMVLNIPNHGHIKDLPEGAIVEASTKVWCDRNEPFALDPIPEHNKGLCRHVAEHQRLLVDAAVTGDKEQLLKALLAEPTINDYSRAVPMFEELWKLHAAFMNGG